MALNIPMPQLPGDSLLQGIDSGSTLMNRIMQSRLERERLKQQQEQFKQQLAHSSAFDPLKSQIMQQQLLSLKHGNDPNYEFQKFQTLMNGVNPAEPKNNFNLDALKKNPMLRGFFKHQFGFDPLNPTQEEKQEQELDLFRKKQNILNQNKGGDIPTNKILSMNQNSIAGIDTVLPMLDELIESKSLPGIFNFSPSKHAAYNAKTSSMIDTLVAAQALPQVESSIQLVKEQIRRQTGESIDAYQKRLKNLKQDLLNRRKRAESVVKTRKVNTDDAIDYSSLSDDDLQGLINGASQ